MRGVAKGGCMKNFSSCTESSKCKEYRMDGSWVLQFILWAGETLLACSKLLF